MMGNITFRIQILKNVTTDEWLQYTLAARDDKMKTLRHTVKTLTLCVLVLDSLKPLEQFLLRHLHLGLLCQLPHPLQQLLNAALSLWQLQHRLTVRLTDSRSDSQSDRFTVRLRDSVELINSLASD